jgi:CRP-like cAMP-binding protein
MQIVDGTAQDIDGHEIAMLTPGEFFGEIALLDGGPRTTVTAETDVVAEVIGQREFSGVVSAPHLARNLLIGLARRLRDADVTSPTSPSSPLHHDRWAAELGG